MSIEELVKLAVNPSFKISSVNLELTKPMGLKVKDVKAKIQEIRDKRDQRRRSKPRQTKPLDDRLKDYLIKLADRYVNSRDLAANLRPRDGQIIDREGRYWLIHAFEFVKYSLAFGTRRNDAAWLCGYDDDHLFVVRVPSTLKKVNDAIAWLKPAGADKEGTLRQGDLWFVPSRSGSVESLKTQMSGTRHELSIDSEGRVVVTHPEHKTLTLVNDKYKVLLGKRIVNGTSRKSHD